MTEFDSSRRLTGHLQQFLEGHVDSFEKLEVLLLLHRSRDQAFTIEAVSERLNLPIELAAATLEGLSNSHLLERPLGTTRLFRFKPSSAELEATIDELATTYQRDATLVVKLIADKAMGRVRSSAARLFADAFRLGKTPTKGKKDG